MVGIYILLHLLQEQNVQITLVIWIIVCHIGSQTCFHFFLVTATLRALSLSLFPLTLTPACLSWSSPGEPQPHGHHSHHRHLCHHQFHHQGLLAPAQGPRCVWLKSEVQGTEAAQELQVGHSSPIWSGSVGNLSPLSPLPTPLSPSLFQSEAAGAPTGGRVRDFVGSESNC